jgi:hypothetical protein
VLGQTGQVAPRHVYEPSFGTQGGPLSVFASVLVSGPLSVPESGRLAPSEGPDDTTESLQATHTRIPRTAIGLVMGSS